MDQLRDLIPQFGGCRAIPKASPKKSIVDLAYNTKYEKLPKFNYAGLHKVFESLFDLHQVTIRESQQQQLSSEDDFSGNKYLLSSAELITQYQKSFNKAVEDAKDYSTSVGWGSVELKSLFDVLISDIRERPKNYTFGEYVEPKERFKIAIFFLSILDRVDLIKDIKTKDGCLSIKDALCALEDEVRTKKFLQAVASAVKELEKRKPEGDIYVLDAGCGPFAVLGLYAALCSSRVRVTGLEINPNSVSLAKEVIGKLNLSDRVNIIEADATKYKVSEKPDLLISETMHSGLSTEPLVQIMKNLVPQLNTGGIVIPQKVDIYSGIIPASEFGASSRKFVLFDIIPVPLVERRLKLVKTYVAGDNLERVKFGLSTKDLPESKDGKYVALVSSEVQCFDGIVLPQNCSHITAPTYLWYGLNQKFLLPKGKFSIEADYEPGKILTAALAIRQE